MNSRSEFKPPPDWNFGDIIVGFFKNIFGGGASKKRTLLDEVQEKDGKFAVDGYRRIAAQRQCAPTSATSDKEILAIYKQVGTAFRKASDVRGEHLPARWLNHIVLKFFNVKEMLGDEILNEHLEYEVNKYLQEGLRDDYKQDLDLF